MSGDEIMVNKAFAEAHPKHTSKMAIARAGLSHRTIRPARMKALWRWQWRWRKRPQCLDEFRSATISQLDVAMPSLPNIVNDPSLHKLVDVLRCG